MARVRRVVARRHRPPSRIFIERAGAGFVAWQVAVSFGGADRDRTGDLRLARAALSQLSYSPEVTGNADPQDRGGGPKWI